MKHYEEVAGEIFRQLAQQVRDRLDCARRPTDNDEVAPDQNLLRVRPLFANPRSPTRVPLADRQRSAIAIGETGP
jgi:hypothetical protein